MRPMLLSAQESGCIYQPINRLFHLLADREQSALMFHRDMRLGAQLITSLSSLQKVLVSSGNTQFPECIPNLAPEQTQYYLA